MFQKVNIPFSTSNVLGALVNDYMDGKEEIKQFYDYAPSLASFKKIISDNNFQSIDRELLVNALVKQTDLVENTSELTKSNIELLKKKTTYTVTTGHQLCLFTGPLFFFYKIISVINLCETLKKEYPENDVVPVYWMASEDHDFEEINNFTVYGKQLKWETTQTGAVGKFKTKELNVLFDEFKSILGPSENAKQLTDLFEKSYLQHANLADATHFLVNELFGKYGLVVINGDNKQLKSTFISNFKKDIFENKTFESVTSTNNLLERLGYKIQVNPRTINCFYMHNDVRGRIEKVDEDNFRVVDTDIRFSKLELEKIIENETEKISPNVVLRPLYQQCILPNLAYVGGPGELSYWLQYLAAFKSYNITYPLLMPRAFVTLIEKATQNKIDKLKLHHSDLYKTETDLINHFQHINNAVVNFDEQKNELESVYSKLLSTISIIDKSLEGTVKSELQKALSGINNLTAKVNKALKIKSEVEINQIKTIKSKLFPSNLPQERVANFSEFYISFSSNFIDELKSNLNLLDFKSCILIEEK